LEQTISSFATTSLVVVLKVMELALQALE